MGNTIFRLWNSFTIIVPRDYVHETYLTSFRERNYTKFQSYDNKITDDNFSRVTDRLISGKTYAGTIFDITARVSSEDCLAFLERQNALFVGAQGIAVTWELKPKEFPKGKWTTSFDKKEALWRPFHGYHRVPRIYRFSDAKVGFDCAFFEDDRNDAHCLLCLCDVD